MLNMQTRSPNFLLKNCCATVRRRLWCFPTVHPQSVDAIFQAADKRNMRMLSGKVLMDENCPETLRDNPESAYSDSRKLIEKWHGKNRLAYAITPRFAVTSSEEQLKAAGKLAAEFPDVHVHTHLAENHDEVDLIAKQFPWSRSYLDVYEQLGLVRERSVFAHCLHLDDQDRTNWRNSERQLHFVRLQTCFLAAACSTCALHRTQAFVPELARMWAVAPA